MTLDEKIVKTKESIAHETACISWCSYALLASGLIMAFDGSYRFTDARRMSAFVYETHQLPFYNKNYTSFSLANDTTPMTRTEYELFDAYKQVFGFYVVSSVFLIILARIALRPTHKQKSKVAENMFNRFFATFLVFLVFYVFERRGGMKTLEIYGRLVNGDKNQTLAVVEAPEIVNGTLNMTESPKRSLRSRGQRL